LKRRRGFSYLYDIRVLSGWWWSFSRKAEGNYDICGEASMWNEGIYEGTLLIVIGGTTLV
jgi:hypothetical protein